MIQTKMTISDMIPIRKIAIGVPKTVDTSTNISNKNILSLKTQVYRILNTI